MAEPYPETSIPLHQNDAAPERRLQLAPAPAEKSSHDVATQLMFMARDVQRVREGGGETLARLDYRLQHIVDYFIDQASLADPQVSLEFVAPAVPTQRR